MANSFPISKLRFLCTCNIINFALILNSTLITTEAKIQLFSTINRASNHSKNEVKTFDIEKGKKLRFKRQPIGKNDFYTDYENREESPKVINQVVVNQTFSGESVSDQEITLALEEFFKFGTSDSNDINVDTEFHIDSLPQGISPIFQNLDVFSKEADSEYNQDYISIENKTEDTNCTKEMQLSKIDNQTEFEVVAHYDCRFPEAGIHYTFKKKEKTKRMHFIEEAAFFMSNNSNETFINSVNILKKYVLSFEKSTVPTYDELAKDFCQNMTIPEKYQKWKIERHPLIDDVLYQSNLDDICEKGARKYLRNILNMYDAALITDYFKMYYDSAIIRTYLRIQDFILIRLNLCKGKNKLKKKIVFRRLYVSLYRLALRELEIDSNDGNNITLYMNKYIGILGNIEKKNHYEAFDFEQFTPNKESEIRKLEERHNKSKYALLIEMESLKPPAIPNIGPLFPDQENQIFIMMPKATFPLIEKKYTTIFGRYGMSLKLEDKRLKEEKIVDIINKIYPYLVNYPESYEMYNLGSSKLEVTSQRNYQGITKTKYNDDEEHFNDFSELPLCNQLEQFLENLPNESNSSSSVENELETLIEQKCQQYLDPKIQFDAINKDFATLDDDSSGVDEFLMLQDDMIQGDSDTSVQLKRKLEDNDPSIRANDLKKAKISKTDFNFVSEKLNESNKRMMAIEKAAWIMFFNTSLPTHVAGEEILKNYLLKLDKGSTVPTYLELANDFCINMTIPEKYNKWKILRHPLIDDVLYQLNLGDYSEKEVRVNLQHIIKRYDPALITDCFKIYNDSAIIRKYLRIEDFILIRLNFRKERKTVPKSSARVRRLYVSLYRLALRELEIDSDDGNVKLYRYRYIKNIGKILRYVLEHNHYNATEFEEFTPNIESEIRKLEEGHNKSSKYALLIEMESLKPSAIPNIGLVFPDQENEVYIMPPKTSFPIIKKENITTSGCHRVSIKLEDKRLNEEKMMEIINNIYNHLVNYPKLYEIYNVKSLKELETEKDSTSGLLKMDKLYETERESEVEQESTKGKLGDFEVVDPDKIQTFRGNEPENDPLDTEK